MKQTLQRNDKFVFLLFVFLTLCVLNIGTTYAQTLKTDGAVPTLNACGANGLFSVTIAKGSAACNAGTLKIVLPNTGFEYEPGSAKIGTTALAETDVTINSTVLTLPLITAGSATDLVTITFEAKATCEAIPLASLPDNRKPVVTYTLNDCTATAQTGQSDIININFAVLKIDVSPNSSQGVIGSVITRVVKVTNTGNGSIGSFSIERTLGSSLEITDITQPAGWTVDASNPNKYIYSGSTLTPGSTVQFTEKVQINGCTEMRTTFEAYYGCTGKCTLGSANGSVSAGISINQSIRPNLQLTVNSSPTIDCFNQEYEHVWTIRNTGTGYSSVAKIFMTFDGALTHAGSYFNENSVTIGGLPVALNAADIQRIPANYVAFGTQGKIRQFSVNIPDLAPGESREIRFKQYYAAPVEDCTKDLNGFIRSYTSYKLIYKHRDGCNTDGSNPDIQRDFSQTKGRAQYLFSGTNVGEVDIVTDYSADFLINNWKVELPDIHAGAYFDILLQLSTTIQPGFDMSQIKLFDPVANKYLTPIVSNLGGGKYQLRINYGTADWPTGVELNLNGYHLQFPVTMNCMTGTTASYTVTGQLNNKGGCTQLLQFACQTVALNTHCGIACPSGGLNNETAVLKRMTYGQVSKNPDDSTPNLSAPAVDPENPPANFSTRNFIGTDILKISQTGTVRNGTATPSLGWTEGSFSVSSPANLASRSVSGSGVVIITRGAAVYTVTGLTVNTNTANTFSIDLGIANLLLASNNLPLGFTYQDNDVIVSSLEIQPMELFNSPTGIKQFPTSYKLSSGGASYSCNGDFSATGYYAPIWLQYLGGGGSQVIGCTPRAVTTSSPSVQLLFNEVEPRKNILFPNEFRQIATPKKAIFAVPAGLTLVGLTVDIYNNSIAQALRKTIPLFITDQSYTLDVEQVVKDLKGGGTNAYLDEGYEIRIYPSVVPTCKSTGTDVMTVEGTMAGTFWNRGTDRVEHQYVNSPEVSIGTIITFTFQTDARLLSATVTQSNVNVTTDKAKWVVQVTNASTFRTFGNVWMGQSAATPGATITSIQQVTDLTGTTPVGTAATAEGGVFQLGNFGTYTTGNKYYLITADYPGCDAGNIDLVYGSDCNSYPTSVASATCSTALSATLRYTPVLANLQTRIVSQNAGVARPKLCEQIPFEIEVNNAGVGEASALIVSVPLPSGGGLNYVPGSFQLTAPFAASTGPYMTIADASVSVSPTAIIFTIPAANVSALKNGEKFRLKFDLTTQGCTFKSGQQISFIASGKNACGSDIAITNPASSNRVTIDGSPINLPELSIPVSSATMDTTKTGTDLTAIYNFVLRNTGDGSTNYPATSSYSFNIKLPEGWVFAGNPQDLVAADQATYAGLDPAKGYVFNLAKDLIVGAEIKITNAKMVYANTATLACNTNFGAIYESAYATFTPVSLCTGTACQIDQLSVENNVTTLAVTEPVAPTGTAVQTFCADNSTTITSIVLADTGLLVWYNSPTSTTALDPATLLVDKQIYYASNQLAAGSLCESSRFAVTIQLDAAPSADAGADQTVYGIGQFTMAGNVPAAGMTGLWTEVIPTGEISTANISSPSDYNTAVTLAPGKTAVLRWTITNGICSAADEVNIAYVLENDLAVSKTADKITVTAGQALIYTIIITNNGPGSLLANDLIHITETLPAGLINITYLSAGGVYDASNDTFKLDADMGSGQNVSLTINGTIAADYQGTSIVNKVSIAPPTGKTDSDPNNNTAEVITPVTRSSDLAVQKIADKTSVMNGDALQYLITITNNGPSTLAAGEVIGVTENLPAGLNNLIYTTAGGIYDPNSNTFTLAAAMATGQTVSFTIKGILDTYYNLSTITNTVTVSTPTGIDDSVPGNNTSTVSIPVVRVTDLSVIKTANKTIVVAGEALSYTLTITNNGQSTLFANEVIQIIETLPSALNNVTFNSGNGTYNNGTFTLAADLIQGNSIVINVTGIVSSATLSGSTITNVVTVNVPSGVTDPIPGNNTADETTTVTGVTDLSIVKIASNMAPVVGADITFTIKVNNNGPSNASLVLVTDLLPTGYKYLSSKTNTGTFGDLTGSWAIGNLTKGAEATLTITVKILATGVYTNTATVTGRETDPDLTNNASTITPVPAPSPPVAVDDVVTTNTNVSVPIPVLANDFPGLSDSPLDPATVQIVVNPSHGTVKVNADGTVIYTPNTGYTGIDSFTYRVKDSLGYWSNIATVTITIISNELKIPNVFTPNGDGNNDTFEIIGIEGYDNVNLIIFNRWGNEVYKSTEYKNNWDGNGLNEGTYYYIIRLKKNEKIDLYKGWVLLKH